MNNKNKPVNPIFYITLIICLMLFSSQILFSLMQPLESNTSQSPSSEEIQIQESFMPPVQLWNSSW